MSISYLETDVTADVSAIRARLRDAWSHRAAVQFYRALSLFVPSPSQPLAETYLLPIFALSVGVIAGVWIV
jgi:hypothetical protein